MSVYSYLSSILNISHLKPGHPMVTFHPEALGTFVGTLIVKSSVTSSFPRSSQFQQRKFQAFVYSDQKSYSLSHSTFHHPTNYIYSKHIQNLANS